MKIQTNSSGTRSIEIQETHLLTIELLNLCLDVIYHPNMKAFGLQQLVLLYINWKNQANNNLGMTARAFQGTPFN